MAKFDAARVSAILIAGLVIAPAIARAESPLSHERNAERYRSPLPVPQLSAPAAPQTPGAKPKPSAASPLDNPEFRFGSQPKARPDDGKREMVDGKPLWNTNDPPNKRGVFAFLGNKIGDPLETLFPKPDSETDKYGMLLCRATTGLPGFLDCADDSLSEITDGAWRMRYRGIDISFVNYRYLDRKLVGFQMGFPTASFNKLGEVLERQYGSASSVEQTDWTNRLGALFDAKVVTWRTPHGPMVLHSRGVSQDAGMLALFEVNAEQRYEALRYKQVSPPAEPAKAASGKPPAAAYDPMER